MAGPIGGAQIRGGNQVGGPNALGLQQDGQGQQAQLIQQLAQKILEMLQQGGGQQQGAQAAQGGQQGAGQTGAGGESLEDMFKKLVEMMQQNPQAARQALQNPAVAQVVQAALGGGGGGGSVGKA
jgi:hypothetical protein